MGELVVDEPGLPFADLRVVELADDPAGEMLGKLLAQMGADVVKVEPPEGARTRHVGPFVAGATVDDPDRSLNFRLYNTNKRSAVVDLSDGSGDDALHQLLATADVLVSTLTPAALRERGWSFDDLCARHPRLIAVSLTPFGLTGPWADWQTSDLVALALSGVLNSCGYDDEGVPPIRPGGDNGFTPAASFGQIAVAAALIERERTGRGQWIDIAVHDSAALTPELANPYWFYPKAVLRRQTCRSAQPVKTQPTLHVCGDGNYVQFTFVLSDPVHWKGLLGMLEAHDLAVDLLDPAYDSLAFRQERYGHIQEVIEVFFLLRTAEEGQEEGQRFGLPVGKLNAPEDLFDDVQLQAREFFEPVEHADGSVAPYPRSPYRLTGATAVRTVRAPSLGEHTGAVLDASQS
jgi:crotonobetainyl-CoA:carnitine CoA-transferase CaiB-like acyl-CoA transferase